MSLKFRCFQSAMALIFCVGYLGQALAMCGMPDPRSSLEEYVYRVAFISGVLPHIPKEERELRDEYIEEYIASVKGLNSIVTKFGGCFDLEEMYQAQQAIRIVAAAMEVNPVKEISLTEEILLILEREKRRDIQDYEKIKIDLLKSLRSDS